jgi:hypothetical protein
MNSYNEKMTALTNQFNFLIADFIKYYVFTNKNPSVNEYRNLYNNNKERIQYLFNDLASVKSNVELEVSRMNAKVQLITTEINNSSQIYDNLFTEKIQSSNTHHGSKSLINDSKLLYNRQFYSNIEIFIGLFILIFTCIKTYTSM